MRVEQPCTPSAEELLSQRSLLVVLLHQPTLLQDGDNPLDEVCERSWDDRVSEIEPVPSCLNPLLEGISKLLGRAYEHGTCPANSYVFRQIPHRPFVTGVSLGETVYDRA